MTTGEDCASVLEGFIHDVANLPAEINHLMEEIEAKDREMQRYQSSINAKDGNLQKHIKLNGSLTTHPKETEYAETILKNYKLCQELQDQKIQLSEKAGVLLDRQIKKLDVKIRELQNDGQLMDGPEIPSLFKRRGPTGNADMYSRGIYSDIQPVNMPLQAISSNTASAHQTNANAHRMNSQHHAVLHIAQPIPNRVSQISASNPQASRSSAPATPAASLQHQMQQQRQRESSAGAVSDPKKRRLNTSFTGAVPSQSSNLRQSSLGPGAVIRDGTPKAGTPTGGTGRSGSVPRSSSTHPTVSTLPTKKHGALLGLAASARQPALPQQVSKLKLHKKHSNKRTGGSPSARSRGGDDADDDSILSSADVSEADSTTSKSRKKKAKRAAKKSLEPDVAPDEEEEEQPEDTNLYCFCQKMSFGAMVGCDNDSCNYQWFHLACVNLTVEPASEDVWYCPECRQKPGLKGKMKVEDGARWIKGVKLQGN